MNTETRIKTEIEYFERKIKEYESDINIEIEKLNDILHDNKYSIHTRIDTIHAIAENLQEIENTLRQARTNKDMLIYMLG